MEVFTNHYLNYLRRKSRNLEQKYFVIFLFHDCAAISHDHYLTLANVTSCNLYDLIFLLDVYFSCKCWYVNNVVLLKKKITIGLKEIFHKLKRDTPTKIFSMMYKMVLLPLNKTYSHLVILPF